MNIHYEATGRQLDTQTAVERVVLKLHNSLPPTDIIRGEYRDILAFVSAADEVKSIVNKLRKQVDDDVLVLELHGSLDPQERDKVLKRCPSG